MGFWDAVYYTGDLVKSAGGTAYDYTSAAVGKVDQVVRVDGIHKYWPDDEKRAQIAVFTITLAKNAGKYLVYEGFKHIPGATLASKLVSDTMRDVEQQNKKDGMKSTSQPEISTQNSKLSSQDSVKDESKQANIARSRM